MQRLRSRQRLLFSGVIIVLQHYNVAIGECFDAFICPLAGSNCRCAMTERSNAIGIFLAFTDKCSRVRKLFQIGEPIEDALVF